MELVNEVTAHLENKPGRLAKICSALAQEKVDIRAITVMESDGPSVLRFVTSDLETTKKVLTSLGTEYRIAEVLAVGLENRTGSTCQGPGKTGGRSYQHRLCLCLSGESRQDSWHLSHEQHQTGPADPRRDHE